MHIFLTPGEPRGLQKYFIRGTTLFSSLGFFSSFVHQTSQSAFILCCFYLAVFLGKMVAKWITLAWRCSCPSCSGLIQSPKSEGTSFNLVVAGSGPAADQSSTTASGTCTTAGDHGTAVPLQLPLWLGKGLGCSPRGHLVPWEHAGTLPLESAGAPHGCSCAVLQ